MNLSIGTPDERSNESGFVLVLGAILILPLIIAVGFAVDTGAWYAHAASTQRAADSAALAGVIFLPDEPAAFDTVYEMAAKNGFCSPPAVTAGYCATTDSVVTPTVLNGNRLAVQIDSETDVFFTSPIHGAFDITRAATAEFVLPAPLGSPRNFLGTGLLGNGSMPPDGEEGMLLSVNGYCTEKHQGDQFTARYHNSSGTNSPANTCASTQNADYDTDKYVFYVDLPAGRTYDTDLIIFDGHYDTSNNSTSCVTNTTDQGCDFNPGASGSIPNMQTTFQLRQADLTLYTDQDNPYMSSVSGCASSGAGVQDDGTVTFADANNDDASDGYTFTATGIATSDSWYNLCRIPQGAPAGRYVLELSVGVAGEGSNNFGLIATPSTAHVLCDSRVDSLCPRIYGKDALSLRLVAQSASADFFLSELGAEHASKDVIVTLWDAAEGTSGLQVLQPTGANAWAPITFDYFSDVPTTGTTNLLDTSGGAYHGNLLGLRWTLPVNYTPPANNAWWRVRITGGSGTVTDRTTWTIGVLGDPVHLVE